MHVVSKGGPDPKERGVSILRGRREVPSAKTGAETEMDRYGVAQRDNI